MLGRAAAGPDAVVSEARLGLLELWAARGAAGMPDERCEVVGGDCLEVLRGMADESVDSVVTDPPYHLTSVVKRFGAENAAPAKHGTDGLYARQSRGFMGKIWDGGDIAFRPELWAEVLRVLKPGGHVAAFSGTRTYHRMACAIEDAGFEVRDQLAWVYGSGFPKSLDVSKAIEKRRIEDVEPVRVVCRYLRAAMDAKRLRSSALTSAFGNCNARLIDHWAARDTDSQPALPTPDQWATLKLVLDLGDEMDGEVARLNARKGEWGDNAKARGTVPATGGLHGGSGNTVGNFTGQQMAPESHTEEARQWEGWGTALKPAWEPICLARKPLAGTVAETVLRHGTGALNVDGCRVESAGKEPNARRHKQGGLSPGYEGGFGLEDRAWDGGSGRWPANLIHDGSDEVVGAFPQTGAGSMPARRGVDKERNAFGAFSGQEGLVARKTDAGSAARFFYAAKASTKDRAGSKHPTVKPVSLMRWLCRLVTPLGGLVLDPFAGSGTTGQAALEEGFRCVLVEREEEYLADIRERLRRMREP